MGKKVFVTVGVLASLCFILAATEGKAVASNSLCNTCLSQSCDWETTVCTQTSGCLGILQCMTTCTGRKGTTAAFCEDICTQDTSGRAQLAAESLLMCAAQSCGQVCR